MRGRVGLAGAVGLVLGSLVLLTPLWPEALRGRWGVWAVALASVGPVLAVGWMAASVSRKR